MIYTDVMLSGKRHFTSLNSFIVWQAAQGLQVFYYDVCRLELRFIHRG